MGALFPVMNIPPVILGHFHLGENGFWFSPCFRLPFFHRGGPLRPPSAGSVGKLPAVGGRAAQRHLRRH
ncbi:MAG: hypothetical protein ACLFRG_15875, partial [Desulfococcaceae bacterium]